MPKSAASPSILFNIDRLYFSINIVCICVARSAAFLFAFFLCFGCFCLSARLFVRGRYLPRTRAARSSPIFTEKGGFGGLELAKRAEKAVFCKVARSSYLPATRFESARPPQFLIFSASFCGCVFFACRRSRCRETFVSRLEGWRSCRCRRFSLAPVHCGALIFYKSAMRCIGRGRSCAARRPGRSGRPLRRSARRSARRV